MGRKLKEISSKILTLSYPRYRFILFLVILILLFVLPFHVIEETRNFSICSKILGKYCYSAGLTRGVSSFLKGDFSQSIEYNILSIPVLIIFLLFLGHDFWKGFVKN
jgi:hypothetical protein